MPFNRIEEEIGEGDSGSSLEGGGGGGGGGLRGSSQQRQGSTSPAPVKTATKAGPLMTHVSGIKSAAVLKHTNSLTRLPKYGVETPHEESLANLMSDIDLWGLDIFKASEYSIGHPLTAITFTIMKVSLFRTLSLSLSLSLAFFLSRCFSLGLFTSSISSHPILYLSPIFELIRF